MNLADFAFLEQFCMSIMFWGSKHPIYQNMNHAIINHCWAGISVHSDQLYQLFLPFRLCQSQKSIFDIFWGAKNGPPEAQEFGNFWIRCLTPRFSLWQGYQPTKNLVLEFFSHLLIFIHFLAVFELFWPFLAPPVAQGFQNFSTWYLTS